MVTRATCRLSKFAGKLCIFKNITSQNLDLLLVLLLMRTVPINESIDVNIKFYNFLTICSWFEQIRYCYNELQATRASWNDKIPKKTFISLTYFVDTALVGKYMNVSNVLMSHEDKLGIGSLLTKQILNSIGVNAWNNACKSTSLLRSHSFQAVWI